MIEIDGRCHCGRIRYYAKVEAGSVAICHCTDCQSLSGSPYRAMITARSEDFTIEGEPRIYVKTADSGTKRAQAFCPNCGSPIYSAAADSPSMFSIRLGSVRQRRELGRPSRQIWCDSALDWVMDIQSGARHSREEANQLRNSEARN